ncbi:MAG: glycosyltransferase [Nitrososphaeria archaeon]
MSMLLYIQKRYGRLLNRKQICIWSSGYDEELFKRVKDYLSANLNILSKLRNILGIRATKVLLYYGSLDKSRLESLILMVETIKLLLNDGFDIQLIILGDGNGINFLKNIIKHNQLESYVIIKPTVPYVLVPVILYVADLVFAPFPLNQNWYVQFPLKIAEAIGMGKPVITTPLIELKCLLPSDFIVEAFDPVALKERVIKILFYSNLDEYSSKIKELQNNLSWATVAKKLSRLIDS